MHAKIAQSASVERWGFENQFTSVLWNSMSHIICILIRQDNCPSFLAGQDSKFQHCTWNEMKIKENMKMMSSFLFFFCCKFAGGLQQHKIRKTQI